MSLAALEVIVHYAAIPADYIGIEVAIPDAAAIATADDLALPEGWQEIDRRLLSEHIPQRHD